MVTHKRTNDPTLIRGADLAAARLLTGLTCEALARMTDVSHDTISRLEAGRAIRRSVRDAIVEALQSLGITFLEAGFVTHFDGRMAPTLENVGRFHGERIRRARWHLRMTIEKLASLTGLSVAILRAMEQAENLQQRPSPAFYKVVGTLQHSGMVFSPSRHGGRTGDRCLVPRRKLEPTTEEVAMRLSRQIGRELRRAEAYARQLENRNRVDRGLPVSERGRVPRSPRNRSITRNESEAELRAAFLEEEGEEVCVEKLISDGQGEPR